MLYNVGEYFNARSNDKKTRSITLFVYWYFYVHNGLDTQIEKTALKV